MKRDHKIRGLVFFAILVLLMSYSLGQAKPETFEITILHSNDFHGANMELLAKRATIINKIRMESANPVLVLDAGDIFTRGPYQKRFYGALEFAIMNEMKYDVITLGNNEFKATGNITAQKILLDRIHQANFPVLCANITDRQSGAYLPGVFPYIIKEFGEIKVAIFGVTTTKVAFYRQAKGWKVTNPILAAENIYNELAGKADIVLALTHIGLGQDISLARKLPKIGAIIGGDSHIVLLKPEMVGNVPVVQAGEYGKYLGRLDLTFEKTESGWKLRDIQGGLINLTDPDIIPDHAVMKIFEDFLKKRVGDAA